MKFRKKPVVIEAWQWDGTLERKRLLQDWCDDIYFNLKPVPGAPLPVWDVTIQTLESGSDTHHVSLGDYVIKGVAGEFYACRGDIFAATYESVPE